MASTEELSTLTSSNYCEFCGIEVKTDTNLRRFGKLFCSEEHMNQYVKARQSKISLSEEYDEGKYSYQEGREEKPIKRRRNWFRGVCC